MAPYPLPHTPTPTAAGFIAACLASSASMPPKTTWALADPRAQERATSLIADWQQKYARTIEAWARSPGPSRRPSMPMYRTVHSLCKHTLSLQDQTGDSDFAGTVKGHLGDQWDDFDGRIEVLKREPPFEPFGDEEATVLAMAQWFKYDFMTWIDPIKCPKCQSETRFSGMAEPTPYEITMGGERVESHQCVSCQTERRFMRTNQITTLLQTKEGRCGEFAQLFYALLQARGIRARYVWNSEDHVWCEYWSPALRHWVHVDSCEAEINKPLLYDQGWGKKQAFCLAFGSDGVTDVTEAYVSDWSGDCQSRRAARGWKEGELKRLLLEATLELRNRMNAETLDVLKAMDQLHGEWVCSTRAKQAEAAKAELGGRDSGTQEWKRARGETGEGDSAK